MKTLKQIREEYDSQILDLVETLPDEIVLEGHQSSAIPSSKQMPIMLLFRRMQYRVFPKGQVVALYYSNTLNKYLSIPFGKDGNLNLSESVMMDESEAWQRKEGKNPEGGLNRKGIMSYRRANPGSKLSMAVTTPPSKLKPGSKAANRRKSFCARMGGMPGPMKDEKGRPTRKALSLRKWNCEESFRQKLEEKRYEKFNEGLAGDAADALVPGVSAYKEYKKGNYGTAALHAGLDLAGLASSPFTGGAGYAASTALKAGIKTGAKAAAKSIAKDGLARTARRAAIKVGGKTGGKLARGAGRLAGGLAKDALKNALAGSPGEGDDKKGSSTTVIHNYPQEKTIKHAKTYTASSLAQNRADATTRSIEAQAARRQAQSSLSAKKSMNENKILDIRRMIDEDIESKDLHINGRTVTLNSGMAKRILEVYDSVNTKNKKIVEGMLNEDLESFKRLLNFSIKA